jgi:hypothetical protein
VASGRERVAAALGLGACEDLINRPRSSRLLAIKVSGEFLTFLIVGKLHGRNDCLVVLIVVELRSSYR